MNDAKTKPKSTASNVIIGLVFTLGGLLWPAFILFFTADAIGDYCEAHSPEIGIAPPWTWRDTLQHVDGVRGILVGFTPPSILLGYGLYLLFSTFWRIIQRLTPSIQ